MQPKLGNDEHVGDLRVVSLAAGGIASEMYNCIFKAKGEG